MPRLISWGQVIEVDGISHEPLTGDYIEIFPGQRYSVIITANQTVDNYWITAPATVRTSSNNQNCEQCSIHKITKIRHPNFLCS